MKRTWKQIGSLLLSVCMVLTMLPTTAFAETGTKDSGEITAFAALAADIAAQTVDTGTQESKLNLPTELTVTVTRTVTVTTGSAVTADVSGNDTATDSEAQEPEAQEETQEIKEEATVDVSGWTSAPAYDGDAEGDYVFTPTLALPDGVTLAAGVSAPQITVTVAAAAPLPLAATTALAASDDWKIGGTAYGTLQDAVNDVQDGQTIVMQRDVVVTPENNSSGIRLNANKTYTLDFGGYTLSNSGFTTYLLFFQTGTVTLQNGSVTAGDNALLLNGAATVNILSGNYTAKNDAIYSNGMVVITEGHFVETQSGGDGALNGSITLANGSVASVQNWKSPTSESDVTITNSNSAFTIGGDEYSTLEDAVKAVQDGETIVMRRNVTLSKSAILDIGKTYTLDFSGYTLSGTTSQLLDLRNGTVTLQNGSVTTSGSDAVRVRSAKVNILSGTYTAQYSTLNTGGTVVITSGHFVETASVGYGAIYKTGGSLTLAEGSAASATKWINDASDVTITAGSTDTTAPVLSAGTVNRTGDTAATIDFTTDEAGTAYYVELAGGAAAPTSAAVKAGTSLGSVSGTVTGKSITLTAGARDIYVVVEDTAGNISEPLKIEAAAYVPGGTDPDQAAVDALKAAIEARTWTVTANTQGGVTSEVMGAITTMVGANSDYTGIGVSNASISSFTAATPGVDGSFTITVSVSKNGKSATAELNGTITALPTAPTITTATLPNGQVGTAYSQTLAATGSMPITWSLDSGSLPGGLALSTSGIISGMPSTDGTFNFTVKAANGTAPDATKALSIVIETAPPAGTAPTITTATLPNGQVGTAYSQALAATGSTPITWSLDSGSLPGGLTLSTSGVISGMPSTDGTFNFTVKAANGTVPDATKELSIVIETAPPAGTAPTITTTTLPNGRVGTVYSQTLTATSATTVTWAVYGGTLPGGLTLSTSGVISGTPTTSGTFNFTVAATNSAGSNTAALSIAISSAPSDSCGGNGGGSGGGSSSGGSSGNTTTTTTPEKKPDQPVTATTPVTATAGTNGAASASIPEKSITDAIAKAQADAKAQGKTANGTTIALNVTMPKGATSLTANLTRNSLNSLVSAGVTSLELNGSPVTVSFDTKALAEIQKQSTGNISITIAPNAKLSASAKTMIGTRPVYDLTVNYTKDGKNTTVSSFGGGIATVSVPYTPAKGEAIGGLYAVYVDAQGNATRIAGSAYDANSGCVIFTTTHFSLYGIGYTAPSAKFTDITTHWAKESIDYVVGRGLLSGTTDTTFAPDTAMTRGMLVTALGRLANVDTKAYTTNSFTDVKADSAFRPYIEWAYSKGIVQGTGNSKFEPDRAITREEIAVIFSNYAKATGYTLPVTRTATTYADASSIGSTYKTAVTAMQQAGIMMGGTNNKFNPQSSATRAEVSSMLHRYIKLTIDPDTAQGWAKNDAGQYLYYKDGKALTGTQTIDGVKYFFETTGVLKTGWVQDGNNWRFYSGNIMLVGFWDLGANGSNKTYYFDTYGNMVSGKWLQIDGKWYYFNADGSLAKSTKIDGYEVDEKGVRKG